MVAATVVVVGVGVVDVDDEVAARIEVVTVVVVEAGCRHCCSIRGHGKKFEKPPKV